MQNETCIPFKQLLIDCICYVLTEKKIQQIKGILGADIIYSDDYKRKFMNQFAAIPVTLQKRGYDDYSPNPVQTNMYTMDDILSSVLHQLHMCLKIHQASMPIMPIADHAESSDAADTLHFSLRPFS